MADWNEEDADHDSEDEGGAGDAVADDHNDYASDNENDDDNDDGTEHREEDGDGDGDSEGDKGSATDGENEDDGQVVVAAKTAAAGKSVGQSAGKARPAPSAAKKAKTGGSGASTSSAAAPYVKKATLRQNHESCSGKGIKKKRERTVEKGAEEFCCSLLPADVYLARRGNRCSRRHMKAPHRFVDGALVVFSGGYRFCVMLCWIGTRNRRWDGLSMPS